MPGQLTQPVNFVNGGDLYINAALMTPTTQQAAKKNPYFAIIGGDWAYADGDTTKTHRWFSLFEIWQNHMITPTGHIVPFVPVIGNHEVIGGYSTNPELAPLYFTFFNKPDKRAYYTIDAGNYLSLFLLDSNHTNTIHGEQAEWLNRRLSERQHIPNRFPAYHVPAWPSFRPVNNNHSTMVREHWVPLFEKYGVQLSFENHDHTFKRTHPILNNRVNQNGVIYIGDGSWGVGTRPPEDPDKRWFIDKATDDHHFWNITLMPGKWIAEAFNEQGVRLDSLSRGTVQPPAVSPILAREELPKQLLLSQNFPNPFNPSTLITFAVPENPRNQVVRLEVFNIQGQRVSTLVNEALEQGTHTVIFDTRVHNLPSGQYIYRLQFGRQSITRSMQLIK